MSADGEMVGSRRRTDVNRHGDCQTSFVTKACCAVHDTVNVPRGLRC
jgi:hypothetical protein